MRSTRLPPDHGLSAKKQSDVKGNKVQLTYLFVANADDSVKLHPLIIGKAHKPRAFNGKTGLEHGFYYWHNATAWVTTAIYSEFLLNWDGML